MEDDLEAQLVQQLAKVQWLRAEKEQREWEARQKAEREAQERECRENEYQVRYQEEQWWKHKAAAQRVAEAKLIQRQVRMLEASGSGRNGDSDVSSPSPSLMYIRLIWKQAAQVSGLETEGNVFINRIGNREKLGASGRGLVVPGSPAGSHASMMTARHPVMGAGNGRSHATFPGGSHAG